MDDRYNNIHYTVFVHVNRDQSGCILYFKRTENNVTWDHVNSDNDNDTITVFCVDFAEFTGDKVAVFTNTLKDDLQNAEMTHEDKYNTTRVIKVGTKVTFDTVYHAEHDGYGDDLRISFSVQINDSLIAAFEQIQSYTV